METKVYCSFWRNFHHVSLKVMDRVNNAKVHNSRAPFTHLTTEALQSLKMLWALGTWSFFSILLFFIRVLTPPYFD